MGLSSLFKSVNAQEILLPVLRRFVLQEAENARKDSVHARNAVIEDARLSEATFKERRQLYAAGNKSRHSGMFHPSSVGRCARELWFQEMGVKGSEHQAGHDALRTHFIFEVGTVFHIIFQNLCQRAGVLVKREVAILDTKLRVEGNADGILQIDGKRYLLEIKTINGREFSLLAATKDAHKRQLTLYMKSTGLPECVVIYFDKDRAELKEFLVKFDPVFYEEYCAKRVRAHHHNVATKTMPERESEGPTKPPCRFCSFQILCWSTDALKKFSADLAKTKQATKPRFTVKLRSKI